MRALLLPCPGALAMVLGRMVSAGALVGVLVGALSGCAEQPRVEGFTITGPHAFLYEARTNTVMTPNDDGDAERIRRYWIADAVMVNALCTQGYRIDTRSYVSDPLGNGGAILYSGRCLDP